MSKVFKNQYLFLSVIEAVGSVSPNGLDSYDNKR
jgi:hypothetical protein